MQVQGIVNYHSKKSTLFRHRHIAQQLVLDLWFILKCMNEAAGHNVCEKNGLVYYEKACRRVSVCVVVKWRWHFDKRGDEIKFINNKVAQSIAVKRLTTTVAHSNWHHIFLYFSLIAHTHTHILDTGCQIESTVYLVLSNALMDVFSHTPSYITHTKAYINVVSMTALCNKHPENNILCALYFV